MAFTEVQIANMALARIGYTKPLTGTTIAGLPRSGAADFNLAAQQITAFYAFSRDWVLRDYPWAFAMALAEVTALDVADGTQLWSGRWQYEYRYPATALLVRAVGFKGDPRDNPKPHAYEETSDSTDRLIRTNVGYVNSDEGDDPVTYGAIFEFTRNTVAVGTYSDDPKFVAALAARLAFDIAPGMKADIATAQAAWNLSRAEILSAQRSDANEESRDEEPDSDFVTAHRSG